MKDKCVKILWHTDYYDGPLTGIVKWNNHRYWFDLKEENNDDRDEDGFRIENVWYRRFNIRKMSFILFLKEHLRYYIFVNWMGIFKRIGYPIYSIRWKICHLYWVVFKPQLQHHKNDSIIGEFEI